jgi:hypothetical protein
MPTIRKTTRLNRVTKHFKPIWERPAVRVMIWYGGVYFLEPLDSRSAIWREIQDIFDHVVTDQEFTVGLVFSERNWIFECNECDKIFRSRLENAVRHSGYVDPDDWSLMNPFMAIVDVRPALRFFTALLTSPLRPECGSEGCLTPVVLPSDKYIATLSVCSRDINFDVSFKSE